jgi:sulfate/thiosulfate-binding protein
MLATTALAACAAPTSTAAPTTAPTTGAPTATSATAAPTTALATAAPTAAPNTVAPTATAAAAAPAATVAGSKGAVEILNVSYDPTRELYQAFNAAFAKDWKEKNGQDVSVKQSHGGSGSQARAVIDGLAADVVTLALAYDVNAVQKAGLIADGWQAKLPDNSLPYYSTIVFVVRKGNPKGIKDWDDLVKPGVGIITPNPKTSGGARWNYLSAWGYALKKNNGDEAKAKDFISKFFQNAPVLDSGARGSTTTFTERGIGDVLVSWENEALVSVKQLGPDKYELVTPSISMRADPPVAVVDKNVDKRGTRAVAEGYLKYLYSEIGQDIAAKNYYRPRLAAIADKYKSQFPQIPFLTIDDTFGGWPKAHTTHFADGGTFDQIYQPKS